MSAEIRATFPFTFIDSIDNQESCHFSTFFWLFKFESYSTTVLESNLLRIHVILQ